MLHVCKGKLTKIVRVSKRFLAVAVAMVFALSGGLLGPMPVIAEGVTYTWSRGSDSGYWHTPGNWKIGEDAATAEPGDGDTVVIPELTVVECVYGTNTVTLQCAGDLTVSDEAILSLAGNSVLTGGNIGGDGTVEISGSGSKLTWTDGSIGASGDAGSLIVGADAALLIEKTGQAALELSVENRGHMSISKGVTGVFVKKGYTQTGTGTLTFEVGKTGEDVVLGSMNISQYQALTLDGTLHVNLADGYMPDDGIIFNVFAYPGTVTRTGQFAQITSSVPSRSFTASYGSTGITLTTGVVTIGTPSAYPGSGTYGGGLVNVVLSSYTADAKIYYTTNGEAPTTGSTLYTGPITVQEDTTIKAFAVKAGLPDSDIKTFEYIIKNDFPGGDGTEENPYLVGTAGQLNKVRDYRSSYFKQTADIDLGVEPYSGGQGWLPIGSPDPNLMFEGVFDGQGKTISNLFISRFAGDAPGENMGLFGYAYGAELHNINLADVDVKADSYVGGLIGYIREGKIKNCTATGKVTGTADCVGGLAGGVDDTEISCCHTFCNVTGTMEVGGLAGYIYNGIIASSCAAGDVTGTAECIGGLVGDSIVSSSITGCYAAGNVTGGSESKYVGGLVGENNDSEIDSCYARGDVTGNDSVGGLVGSLSQNGEGLATIVQSYSAGAVTGTANVGGFVGKSSDGSVTSSYWDKETSGQELSAGGTGKTTADMKNKVNYAAWNFESAWDIDGTKNNGYPFLRALTAVLSMEAEITAFSFSEQTGPAAINFETGTIDIEVANDTNVTNLAAKFTLSSKASAKVNGVAQISGTTLNDFTNPVTYVVTAEDGITAKNWTVTVTVKNQPPADGESFWQCRSPKPTPHALSEVKYVNGKFMAAGSNGTMLTSTDGENWDSAALDTEDYLQGIAYGNGKYIVVGYSEDYHGVIYASGDGTNWSLVQTVLNQRLSDVIYGNGKFAAVGYGNMVVTSSDGVTWETKAVGDLGFTLSSITYANGVYVAVGQNYSKGHIITSADGENWTKQTSVDDALADVTFGNGKFVAVVNRDISPGIYTSSDNGVSWTKETASSRLFTVDYDGSRFIAAGNDSWDGLPYVLTSTDGTIWEGGKVQIDASFRALASGGGKYAAVGYKGIVTSTDRTNWTLITSGTFNDLLDVAYNGSTFVSVGEKGTLQTSPDGITWNVRSSGTTEYLRTVKYLNGKFVAVGNQGVILTSEDGTNWIKKTSGANRTLYDVTYGNGLYVVVGGTEGDAVIYTSSDGVAWTSVTHGSDKHFTAVNYGNGIFIALTYFGRIYTSGDGAAWSSATGSLGYPEDIIYADGRFIVTGGLGQICISDDGVNWTVKKKVCGEKWIYSVAYGGGNLVAVTQDGKILISFDKGDTWSQQLSGFENQRNLNGVTAGSSNFVAVGTAGLTLQSKDFGAPGNPDADAVAAAKAALTWNSIKGGNITQDNVTANLVSPLPTTGANGTTLTWSADPDGWINTTTGAVTRPSSAQGDKTVILTTTITKEAISDTKAFTLTIKAADITADETIALDLAALTWNVIKGSNSSQTNVTSNLALPTSGAHGTTISWSVSPDEGWINTTTGAVTRPSGGKGNVQVTLTATISKEGGTSATKSFSLTIPALPGSGTGKDDSGKSDSGGSGVINEVKKPKIDTTEEEKQGPNIGVWNNPFNDVDESDWYYETVMQICRQGLMRGTAPDNFSPGLNTTRATIITILYRLEGEPEVTGDAIFSDVPADTWYTNAVIWAAENDIITGYDSGEFGTEDLITREQLAALLYRYSKYKGYDNSTARDFSAFTDADQVSEWAETAMQWAVGAGIIQGKPGNVLDPKGTATRAEIAAMLSRYIQNLI